MHRGIYWSSYDFLKDYFESKFSFISPPVRHVCSAIISGGLGDIITNPFWVVRTRLQTLIMNPEAHIPQNISTLNMFVLIYKEEGLLSFYKGLGASFLGLVHVALQFPLYEYLKLQSRKYRNGQ